MSMMSFSSTRRTRYTAIVMLFVWLMTLGIGIANACLTDGAQMQHGSATQVQTAHHEDSDAQSLTSDKLVCLKVCDVEKTAAVKKKQR